jgi:AcrR family transcriptional regulator
MRSTRATLDRMLEAAAEMFSQKGYAATTFRDVASEGAINNNSIFRRILNKQDLAKQALQWEADKIEFARLLNEAKIQLDPEDPSNIENLIVVLVKTVVDSRLAMLCLRALQGECDPEITEFAKAKFIFPVVFLIEAFLKECVRLERIEDLPIRTLYDPLLGAVLMLLRDERNRLVHGMGQNEAGQDARSLAGTIVRIWLKGITKEEPLSPRRQPEEY